MEAGVTIIWLGSAAILFFSFNRREKAIDRFSGLLLGTIGLVLTSYILATMILNPA